ncbi:hypothetical protein [Xanthomonas translucens]|uniref:hypothetical protein n=1 Tax=Xanthomonas campestris pv. translucens TaxID=343 RepID=UPI00100824AA|nr:hypothetical protein [Xanthomonas translucens]MCC8447240.1 hypothetical protein [Xanthomonas translucens pv. translucens]MCS3359876.1 hypothetical protein [Xanthomonas translucens pv. translucens]MCS3373678.1 hypothetical protein [Xanthomonas translucens pv. translucens]MCT8274364.1 hypothetical protein [Xanthomonas translucens pv. translucens]MCT8278274.1 hypothetical protein [Xanthomonas translucens pv. translucens]
MSDYHVKLVNVRLKKITESGAAATDQVKNNSWVVSAGLPIEVQGNERDFEFEESFDGDLIGDENFVALWSRLFHPPSVGDVAPRAVAAASGAASSVSRRIRNAT